MKLVKQTNKLIFLQQLSTTRNKVTPLPRATLLFLPKAVTRSFSVLKVWTDCHGT